MMFDGSMELLNRTHNTKKNPTNKQTIHTKFYTELQKILEIRFDFGYLIMIYFYVIVTNVSHQQIDECYYRVMYFVSCVSVDRNSTELIEHILVQR